MSDVQDFVVKLSKNYMRCRNKPKIEYPFVSIQRQMNAS